MSIFLTKLKSGNDLPFFPELVTLKEKKFSHSFLLISIRNTALNREQSETHFQEVIFRKGDEDSTHYSSILHSDRS
jgi:hypothetical protein